MRGQVAHGINVGGLAREDVILGNGFEQFRREGQIHRVSGLSRKINGEPGKNRVHGFDPAKTPTAVNATPALGQLRERLNVASLNFAGSGQFLEFCSHKKIVIFPSGVHYALLNVLNDQKPREIADRVLRLRRERTDFTEDLLETALAGARLSPPDRGLCQELVYGIVRWQGALDWLIARKTPGREQAPGVQILLQMGLYQIFWLDRIPPHAAVHETVELAKRNGFGPQAGFINAVLRGSLREVAEIRQSLADLKIAQPAVGWSHPEWLVNRWQQRWGGPRTTQLLQWNNTPPKTFARLNRLKTDAAALIAQWREEGVAYDFVRPGPWPENQVFELKSHPPLGTLKSFADGWFYVQDPSTLLAVSQLRPQPGDTVLDLCAAPGGKTTFIAQLMNNQGKLVAHDVSEDRLQLIRDNCRRLGITCVTPTLIPPSSSGLPVFDRILVDAPCSNTGVMRRRVDLRWRIQPAEIIRLRATQLALLDKAAALLKPEGVLVYSTCSLEPEENQEVVAQFISGHRQFQVLAEQELIPFVDNVDGAYVARITRRKNEGAS
jgi:16S rRNA (cytosine967-C5)-methyltransferase